MFRWLLLSIILVGGIYMSHPINDEILERLYEEVTEEFPNALEPFVLAEVQKRFEDLCQ